MDETERPSGLLDGPTDSDVTAALIFSSGSSCLAFEAEAKSASSPLAAALLLGLTVPDQHAERVADAIMSGRGSSPVEGVAGDDGSRSWEWDVDGVVVVLRSFEDGRSDAYCKATKAPGGGEAADGSG